MKYTKLVLIFLALMLVASFASLTKISAVTYYHYNFQGPYYYDGSVPSTNQTASIAALWANNSRVDFNVHVTSLGTSVSTYNLTSTNAVYQVLWNSSSSLGLTSVIDFQPTVLTYNVNIYIPASTSVNENYTFVVTDFFGMTHPYLECGLTTNGIVNLLQQSDLSAGGTATFVLAQYGTYTLTFLCDQGSYSQQFTAGNIFSTNLEVLAGMFPTSNATVPTVVVQRLNATMVGIVYNDPTLLTNWLTTSITHISGIETINDYSTNTTGNTQTILWNGGDSDKDYTVTAIANINGVNNTWILTAPYSTSTNPFLGIFDYLGPTEKTLPYVTNGWPLGMTSDQIAELIPCAIVVLFLCIGSFRSAGACAILSWVIFGILMALGWFGIVSVWMGAMFALSGCVGIFMYLADAKEVTRET